MILNMPTQPRDADGRLTGEETATGLRWLLDDLADAAAGAREDDNTFV
ncbi:hypothetical protein ABZ023_24465 [Streptomyces sp. NPDC006367]